MKGFQAATKSHNLPKDDFLSARDRLGHGTHVSSTAAGRVVANVSALGFAAGTAKGGAPLARVAAYKVCWTGGCASADILAAFDAGISDGVNVFSVSMGGNPTNMSDFLEDPIAIGAFHAVQNNISVVASAGNSGPAAGTVSNVAPWIITVAASSIDRDFPSAVVLGNNVSLRVSILYRLKC